MNDKTDHSNLSADALQTEMNDVLLTGLSPIMPPPARRETIASRLETRVAKSVLDHAGLVTVRNKNGTWHRLKDGVKVKTLWQGPAGNSVLIELAPGAHLPVHRHNWAEEGVVLQGGLQLGQLELGEFDYHFSPAGSRHGRIQSRQGALAYLRGTSLGDMPATLRELLSGLLPFKGGSEQTVFFGDAGWQPIAPGVFTKVLHSDGIIASRLLRVEPGSVLPGHHHPHTEECMMLSGELFLGDILLRAGEYQLAPAGSWHGDISSDTGALLFVRGASN